MRPMLIRVLFFVLLTSILLGSSLDPSADFYAHIQDIRRPTQKEMQMLQYKLSTADRPILERMPETGYIPRELQLISENPAEQEVCERIVLRCGEKDRENCIIIYSSFNERYPLGVKRLIEALRNSDYQGHVIFRIGGWPNVKNGDLKLAHVPFAFKPCFFKEVQQLGYQRVLWLDSSVLPAPGISLNWVFDAISALGVFIQANDHTIVKYMNEDSAQAFGITLADTQTILSCSAAIIGLDMTNSRSRRLLDAWYAAAHHPFAFFSDRSDQNALSILIHQMGLTQDLLPRKLLGSLSVPRGGLFLMDRSLVKFERD